jgi:RyR domain
MLVADIARVCHEANREYCKTIGDRSQPSWEEAPNWQKVSALKGVEFHIGALKSGFQPSPSASHESWLAEKRRDGWCYGPVKDAEKKEHPCFLPYDELPIEQRLKDFIFSAIVEAFYKAEQTTLVVR